MDSKNSIIICGPTASGKTSLAVKIAEELSINQSIYNNIHFNNKPDNNIAAEIISADSRQIYCRMDIGTGKDLSEYNTDKIKVPYHCIDIRNPNDFFTLYEYLNECRKSFTQIIGRNRIPIITGGTGLYIKSVIKNYELENIPPDFHLRNKLEKADREELENKLMRLDPEIYKNTDLSSRKRIIRGIEKALHFNNISNEDIKKVENTLAQKNTAEIKPLVIAAKWKRDELVARIEKRLDERFEEGMIDEVSNLLEEGITPERMHFLGLEYRYLTEYITGLMSFVKMREKLFTEIRRFSKRQLTFFRGMEKQGIEIHYIDNADLKLSLEKIREYNFDIK